jgi:phospholipid/cholesterol/gamma-HCH transport system substrate-binding protein
MIVGKEAKVGILAVVAMAILYLGFNFLKGSDVFSGMNDYTVTYKNVDGLVASNAVMLNGLQVGKVKSITLIPEKNNALLATLSISRNILLGKGTIAELADNGFLGGKMINLKLSDNKTLVENGGELVGSMNVGIAALIKEKTLPVLSNVDTLVSQLKVITAPFDSTGLYLNRVLKTSDRTMLGINGTMANVNGTLSENKANLLGITNNMKSLTASLIETEKGIAPLMGKVNTFADSLNAMKLGEAVASTKKSLYMLQNIMADLNAGKGTAGKLMKDDSMYIHLNRTLADLDRLFINLKDEPKRYVHFSLFGNKKKKEEVVAPK